MKKRGFSRTLALLGCGKWGKNLARNFEQLGVLHTLCDPNEAVLDALRLSYPEVKLTTNPNTVLEDSLVTQVVIAAPSYQHYELAKKALLAGKDVYVEKPLCLDSSQAEELIALAGSRGAVLMVGHLLQYHPYVEKLHEIASKGELGTLQYIVSNRLNLGALRMGENALWDLAPHDVSVILSLAGSRLPESVRCVGESFVTDGVCDTTLTTLKFEGNVRAHIHASRINPFKEQKLTVVGTDGLAVFDDTLPWDSKLLLYKNHLNRTLSAFPSLNTVAPEKVVIPQMEPLRLECEHFLLCCQERAAPKTDGVEGLRVLKVLQAAQASLEEDGENKNPEKMHADIHAGKTQAFAKVRASR